MTFLFQNQPFWLFSTPDEQPKGTNKKPYTDLIICMPENKMEKHIGTKLPDKPRDLDPYGSMRRLSARGAKFEENQVTNNTVKTIVDLMNDFGVPRRDAQQVCKISIRNDRNDSIFQPEKTITFMEPQKILTYPRTFGKSHVVKRKDWTPTGAGLCHRKREGGEGNDSQISKDSVEKNPI